MSINFNTTRSSFSAYSEIASLPYGKAAQEDWMSFASTETPVFGKSEYNLNVYRNGEAIGCLVLQQDGDGLHLKLLRVSASGAERHLLSFAESHARRKGAARLVVSAPHFGIPFYVRNGYQQTGNFHHDHEEGTHFFRMEKELA